jgi:hypothetical protein
LTLSLQRSFLAIVGLVARLGIIAIPVLCLQRWREELFKPVEQWSETLWWKVGLSIAALIIADYIKDWIKDRQRKKTFESANNDIYGHLGAAQKNLLRVATIKVSDPRDLDSIFKEALKHIEHLTEIIYGKARANGQKITANLMIYESKKGQGKTLRIRSWGTELPGRKPLTLKVEPHAPAIGAPTSVITRDWQYIKDTRDKTLQKWFPGERDYRTILSIPLFDDNNGILGVVNIDSDEPNAFNSMKEAKKKLAGPIEPILSTFRHFLQSKVGRVDQA